MAPLPTETPQDALLSSAFRHLPFSSPLPPTISKPPSSSPRSALEEAVNAADRILKPLAAAASGHPFSRTVHSLTSEFRAFFQVRFSVPRITSSVSTHNFAAILPGDSMAGLVVVNGISNFLNLYNTVLVVRLVLTWFPNSPPAIVTPLSTICDPYLNIFRGIIPPLGGLDLSPILAFLVLNFFTSTAAALPAELPAAIGSHKHASSHPILRNLSSTQEKWIRRVCSKGSKN